MLFRSSPFSSVVLMALLQASPGVPASQTAAPPPLPWASVSIHESDPARDGGNYSNEQPNGVNLHGMSLREIISDGYNFSVMPLREEEITGLPDWARTTRYDILARVDADDVEAFKKLSNLSMEETVAAFTTRQATGEMLMVQSLLADRFHLRVHWDSKERSVYTLSVAKGGLRLKPAADPKHGEMTFSQGHLAGKGVPLSFLATLLALPGGRTVVDRTALAGAYDFDLHFDPHDSPADTENGDPGFFTAVEEQLGLKLQSTRASVPVLAVDHIERPTPN